MLDRRLRATVEQGLGPLGRALGRLGITPDALTVIGLLFAVGTAVAVASGHLVWGAVGIALSGLGDLLDGNLARSSGRTGPRGSFFDSVTDRVSDALVLGGVAWYVADTNRHLPVLALAVAALSMLISYERAKAESMGFDAKGGLMERAERSVLLGVGMAFDVLVPVLWIMFVLTLFTAVQRFVRVWRQAERPTAPVRSDATRRAPRAERSQTSRPRDDGAAVRLRTWLDLRTGPNARAQRSDRAATRRVHSARSRTRP